MKSFVFNGRDFSEFTSAKVVERGSCGVVPDTRVAAGRAGALFVGGRLDVKRVVVRLYLDAGYDPGTGGCSDIRHRIAGWLSCCSGGVLVLPDEPELELHDVVCTDSGVWSGHGPDSWCDVTFVAYDPIAWGRSCVAEGGRFEVDGSWPTWPVVRVVAEAGTFIEIRDCDSGQRVRVERAFVGGEQMEVDFATETVVVDGEDATSCVDMNSDFFCLRPSWCELAYLGCRSHEVGYRERWV